MNKRGAVVVAVLAVLLVPLLAASASAHAEHKVDNDTVEVGFGTEPAYAGVTNSVQLNISNNGRPVTDAKAKEMVLQPYFGADFGEPGDYRAFFIPTAPGPYTFKVTGTLGGRKVDQRYTSGKDGFDEVTDPAEAQHPVRQPSGSQLTSRLDRETNRLNAAVAAHRVAADQDVAEARRLATVGLAVGALGLLTAVGVGVVALRRRS